MAPFRSLDEDCAALNEPLDTFIQRRSRTNLSFIESLGQHITWSPRCWDTLADAYLQTRPYASAYWSTALYVPWLLTDGLTSIRATLWRRVQTENGSAPFVDVYPVIEGVTPVQISRIEEDGWGVTTLTRNLAAPFAGEAVQPLALWVRSGRLQSPVLYSAIEDRATFSLNDGRLDIIPNAGFIPPTPSLRPKPEDLHVAALYWEGEEEAPIDVLWSYERTAASATDGQADIWRGEVYPALTYTPAKSKIIYALPLSYMQLRSVEIEEKYATIEERLDRYLPRVTEEAIETQRQILDERSLLLRPRCVWVGPRGSLADPEAGNATGYGERFERVAGNASYQSWLECPLNFRTDRPRVRVLIYAVPVIRNQVGATSATVRWELEASTGEVASGVAVSDAVSELFDVTAVSTRTDGASPFLTQERRLETVNPLYGGNLPFKEGQLFAPDIQLVQLFQLEMDAAALDPSATPYPRPRSLRVRARISGAPVQIPSPIGGLSAPATSDYGLVCVGWTVWEVPNG